MSQAEKRYFKRYASMSRGGSNLVQLFDAIATQKTYNEDEIRTRFKGKAFVRQLGVAKHSLYGLVLRSLRAFQHEKNIAHKVLGMMHDIQILYEKGLLDQCEYVIKKADQLAAPYGRILTSVQLHEWRNKIAMKRYFAGVSEEDLEIGMRAAKDQLKKAENIQSYFVLVSKMFMRYYRFGVEPSDPELEHYAEILSDPLMADESLADSPQASYYYHYILAIYAVVAVDWEKAYLHFRKLANIVQEFPILDELAIDEEVAIWNNMLAACYYLEYYDQMEEYIRNLNSMPSRYKGQNRNRRFEVELFSITANFGLMRCLQTGKEEEGLEWLERIEGRIAETPALFTEMALIQLYYNAAYFLLAAGKPKEALKWNNLLLANASSRLREDILCYAKLLSLLIHYELEHYDLLEYLSRSAYRELYRKKRLYQYEKLIIEFLRSGKGVMEGIDAHKEFRQLRSSFGKLEGIPSEKYAMMNLDLITWLDSRLEGTTMTSCFRARLSSPKKNQKGLPKG